MRKKRSSPLTLIEVLLTCTLIALAGGWCLINLPRALETERFQKSLSQLNTLFEISQEWALATENTIVLHLCFVEHTLQAELLPSASSSLCTQMQKPRNLKGIHRLEWRGEPKTDLEIRFIGKEIAFDKGTLVLHGSRGQEALFNLPGYPCVTLRNDDAKKIPSYICRPTLPAS